MTYCIGIEVENGLVLASDSRTNAGVDHVSTYSKMHRISTAADRSFTVLSAGNLATTQAVVRQLKRDIENGTGINLDSVASLAEAAEYLGDLSVAEQQKHAEQKDPAFDPSASFILAGQIRGRRHQVFMIYPEGNYIRPPRRKPYLQIGDLKYGKPILDRIVVPDLSLENAARCALVSMDSTMRSNVSVGPPIELLICAADSFDGGQYLRLNEDDDYLAELREAWHERLREAFDRLPELPVARPQIRLIDAQGD